MPRVVGPSRGDGVQAVMLALQIIELMARQGGAMGVTELSLALATPKSRIHRHLRTLVEQQYLVQALDSEKYRIGNRLTTLGRLVSHNSDIVGAARGPMRELRDALGHSVVVSQFEADGVCVLETLSGNSPIEIGVKRGSILGFTSSAQGKVALAYAEDAVRARVFAQPLPRLTPHTIVAVDELEAEIDVILARGWAVSPNETVLGTNALSAPIFDGGGLLAGTLAIVGSVQFIEATPSAEQIRQVTGAADGISTALGGAARRTGAPRRRPAARHDAAVR
jgi:IclR family KDG regulon transcriptional repressor